MKNEGERVARYCIGEF